MHTDRQLNGTAPHFEAGSVDGVVEWADEEGGGKEGGGR